MTQVQTDRRALAERVRALSGGMVYVLGGTDTGKTSLAKWLAKQTPDRPRRYLDCDPGQSVLGPPSTVGLATVLGVTDGHGAGDGGNGEVRFGAPLLSFVGSTSPARHLLQTLSAIGRLAREVEPSELLVCDSSGFVSGRLGSELQYNLLSLLRPQVIVALGADDALRATLRPFEAAPDIEVHYFDRDPDCGTKSRGVRADYREERLRQHFVDPREYVLGMDRVSLHGMIPETPNAAAYRHRLCALLDRRQFVLSLGLITGAGVGASGVKELRVFAPQVEEERVSSVQLGSLRLAPDDLTYRGPPGKSSPSATSQPETGER